MKWIILLLILCGCANRVISTVRYVPRSAAPLPPSPFQSSEFRVQSSKLAVPRVTTLTLEWDYPGSMDGITGFCLYRGTNTGSYFAEYPVTLTNRTTVTFTRQIGQVDYFVCVSTNLSGLESLPSNEVRWPPPSTYVAPTNVILSWNAPAATIEGSSNLVTWRVLTNISASTITFPIQPGCYFYRISADRQTQLTIEAR